MRVFNRRTLIDFYVKHPDVEQALRLWFSQATKANWRSPQDIKAAFGSADFLPGNRAVFNIKGNAYRLVVQVKYGPLYLVYIRFVGTHAEYDRIDAAAV